MPASFECLHVQLVDDIGCCSEYMHNVWSLLAACLNLTVLKTEITKLGIAWTAAPASIRGNHTQVASHSSRNRVVQHLWAIMRLERDGERSYIDD
jgi:hypothetical protein